MATRVVVQGRVQGVGFRYAMADEAKALGLSGWVRNRSEGSVEACVLGPAAAIDKLVAWAHRGPPAAHVSDVAVGEMETPHPPVTGFDIRPTA